MNMKHIIGRIVSLRNAGRCLAMVLLFGCVAPVALSQSQSAGFVKDDVYFSVARRINERTTSPVSAIVAELGGVIEIDQLTKDPDGKVTAVVKETTPSNARATNKSIRLTFVPTAEKNKWKWDSFEDNRKMYEVEKLFPYTKDRLDKAQQLAERLWTSLVSIMLKEGEAAVKVVDTARAILKADPAPYQAVVQARTAFEDAAKGTEIDVLRTTHSQLEAAIEPVLSLGDNYPELKTNDAFLRLQDELRNVMNVVKVTRKGYLDAVDIYNDDIRRLPFALVAYGMEYTRMESKIQPE